VDRAPISDKQRKKLWAMCYTRAEQLGFQEGEDGHFKVMNSLLKKAGVNRVEQLHADSFDRACAYIETAVIEKEE
jgi:hypothetical protein